MQRYDFLLKNDNMHINSSFFTEVIEFIRYKTIFQLFLN
jgi:hypothetical protein